MHSSDNVMNTYMYVRHWVRCRTRQTPIPLLIQKCTLTCRYVLFGGPHSAINAAVGVLLEKLGDLAP